MAVTCLLHRLARNERGVALVEFALVLPILLLFFAVTIEGTRMMWSYQTAIAGVRDAARYLGRIVPTNVCAAGQSFPNRDTLLTQIVRNNVSGTSVVPTGVTVNSVTSSLTCVTGTYRVSPAPVAVVSANVTITFPFARIIAYASGSNLGTITTTITDRSRVLGS